MNATTSQMVEMHERMTAAVNRNVAKGQSEREAFKVHMLDLMKNHPTVANAYRAWLASGGPTK